MRLRWIRRLVLLALLASAALGVRYWLLRPQIVPVTVYRVVPGTVESTVTTSKAGTIKSRQRATLSPEIGGRVDLLAARKGERVRRGDVLLRLNDADYRAERTLLERSVGVARATQAEACRGVELATREVERTRQLVAEGISSRQLLDQQETARDSARAVCDSAAARVAQAEAALNAAKVAEAKTVLRAPFDGVVADVRTELGEWITPSPPGLPIPPVIELFNDTNLYVSAPLDEVDVAKVRTGLPVRVTMDAYPGRPFAGHVVRLAKYVEDREAQNRTFEVEVALDDAASAGTLLPGTSADVEVVLDARDRVLRVPTYALLQGDRVLVLRGDTLASVTVTTGLRNWDFVEVTGGLAEGDRVVVSLDRVEVREGARVRVEAETAR